MFVEPGADGTLHVVVKGELDLVAVEALKHTIDAALALEASRVLVDAAELRYVDSWGLAVLVRLARRFGDLEIQHATKIVRQQVGAAGLSNRLRLVDEQRPGLRRHFPERPCRCASPGPS